MSVIGTLAANILAKTSKFDKPVDASRRKYNKFRKDLKDSTKDFGLIGQSLGSLGINLRGFITGFTALAAARSIHRTINEVDALGKQAHSLGLTVDALDKYQFAAGRAGISVEKVGDAIKMMNKNIGDAKAGLGRARRFFELKELNVDLKTFFGLKPTEQFEKLLGTISRIEDLNLRLAASSKIFGEGAAAELLRLIEGGNLRQATADLQRLGGAITEKEWSNAAKYVDAVGDLTRSMRKLGVEIGNIVAPVLTPFFTQLAEGIAILRGSIPERNAPDSARDFSTGRIIANPLAVLRDMQDAFRQHGLDQPAPEPLNTRQRMRREMAPPMYEERQNEMLRIQRAMLRKVQPQITLMPSVDP